MALSAEQRFRVAVGVLGAIGGEVAARLDQGIPGLRLTAVAARDVDKAQRRMVAFREAVPVVSLGELAGDATWWWSACPPACLPRSPRRRSGLGGYSCR